MKFFYTLKTTAAFFIILIFSGCLKDSITKTYTIYKPVYKDKAEVLNDIKSSSPQPIKNPGKIYLYGSYLFMNDVNRGVHIIDNRNPSKPVNVAFINIPGNVDIAVKAKTLYADLYTDLLAIDISDPLQAKFKSIVNQVFPERNYGFNYQPVPGKIIVDWIKKDTTVNAKDDLTRCINCFVSFDATSGSAKSVTGVAGSMSRFAIVQNYMYAVNISSLNVLNISNQAEPVKVSTVHVGWNIETIFPFKDKLFIGSGAGMFIYNINNLEMPVRQGSFTHARACDPVVADDDYAFVTLRTGNFCTGVNNQLDVVNVQNVMYPILVKTYPLTNPHGLAKDGDILFVCDGKDGLKIYNASNIHDLKLIKRFAGIETFDAIAWNDNLIVVAEGGLYQYNYSDVNNIRLVSKINVEK